MKKQILISLILLSSVLTIKAQTLYLPNVTNPIGTSTSNNSSVGIGNPSPSHKLDILGNAISGYENLFRVKIDDAPSDYFEIANNTSANGQFIPFLSGFHASDNRLALYISGSIPATMDNGDNPVVMFDARYPDGPVKARPLFSWGSYGTNMMQMTATGNLLIGVTTQTNSAYKLEVNGTIHTREIVVDNTNWADYVFHPSYRLKPLAEVEQYIKTHGHLENIPTAKEVERDGVNVGDMQKKLLEKMEETTLYLIEQANQIKTLKNENTELQKLKGELQQRLDMQEKAIEELKASITQKLK